MDADSTLGHEVADLRCLIEDLARRVRSEAPGEALAIAAMLRSAATLFERLDRADLEVS